MNQPLVSIIVPVYNVENHLEKCISSILNQTLNAIEIIAINDGSTDKSLSILESLSKQDNRLKVINQENQGVSAARNKGLSLAQGEYIGFVDADDYIEAEMYEKLYQCANQYNCDVIVANVFDETEDARTVSLEFKTGKVEVPQCHMDQFLEKHFFKFGHAVWHKLFNRQLIEDNNLTFHPYTEVSSEDMIFNLSVLACTEAIYYLDEPLYHYVIHKNSLTKSYQAKSNMTARCQQTVMLIKEVFDKKNRDIPLFLNYLTYIELLRALSQQEIKASNLKDAIRRYSQLPTFRSSIKLLATSSDLNEYFINEKGSYSKLYQGFDRLFAYLCLLKCYALAANLHMIRMRRACKIKL